MNAREFRDGLREVFGANAGDRDTKRRADKAYWLYRTVEDTPEQAQIGLLLECQALLASEVDGLQAALSQKEED